MMIDSLRLMVLFSFFAIGLVVANSAQAISSFSSHGMTVTVEPIIGYEYTHLDYPHSRRTGMLIYGARVVAGRPGISAELEYTRGTTAEAGLSPTKVVDTTKDNARLGVRGTYQLVQAIDAIARVGGQATKISSTATQLDGTRVDNAVPWKINPYAGAGLQLFGQNFVSGGLDAVYVFNSLEDFSKNTVQLNASLRVHFK